MLGLCARLGLQSDTLLNIAPVQSSGTSSSATSSEIAPGSSPRKAATQATSDSSNVSGGSPIRRSVASIANGDTALLSSAAALPDGPASHTQPSRLSLPAPAAASPAATPEVSTAGTAIPRSSSIPGSLANANANAPASSNATPQAINATPGAASAGCNLIPEWFIVSFTSPYRAADVFR